METVHTQGAADGRVQPPLDTGDREREGSPDAAEALRPETALGL